MWCCNASSSIAAGSTSWNPRLPTRPGPFRHSRRSTTAFDGRSRRVAVAAFVRARNAGCGRVTAHSTGVGGGLRGGLSAPISGRSRVYMNPSTKLLHAVGRHPDLGELHDEPFRERPAVVIGRWASFQVRVVRAVQGPLAGPGGTKSVIVAGSVDLDQTGGALAAADAHRDDTPLAPRRCPLRSTWPAHRVPVMPNG